jgi:alpha/beta superfamily hydrolase
MGDNVMAKDFKGSVGRGLVAALVMAGSMGAALAAPDAKGETVTFESDDGIGLSGVWYGTGDKVVIFSHQYNHDQDSWKPLVDRFVEQGYAVLTYNFRGYPPSAGTVDIANIGHDLTAAVAFAKGHGASHFALVSASMGGIATVPAAVEVKPDAYVLVSAPAAFGGLEATDAALIASDAAKLFINSENDPAVGDTRHMAEVAKEPKALEIYPSAMHGTDLFKTAKGDEILARIVGFVDENLPL